MIKIFFDLETTGLNVKKHSVHQIAGLIEIDGGVVETFDIKTRPHLKAELDTQALKICNKTEAELLAYPEMNQAHFIFSRTLRKYIDKYNPKDKAFLIGFNASHFDCTFLRAWFEQNNDSFFDSWFWKSEIDVMSLAAQYLLARRVNMPSFKLKRVAMELGIEVNAGRLHDALYDVELTRGVYRIITGLEVEL
jgi:DNA polymerase-3 subunit epsilon